ncbi:Fur family transcriptional regulator [Helicobacter turcicus]|uniref:Transcriptional repressor n=1 Tax=Helicobacter turcicus TaxID=2867412 RepID=A0ABS7JLZ0_9HELI|nr:Fur family transcriptional regulator [Helicobacter turcicus]MBX7490407.1 transcriptional repressor [Helicobacter turcicus]MBX7545265.1 transcriptional repressor [Helicobacter turcicus]
MFEKLLKDNNLKITPQRLAILKEIQKFGHIGIDEIYENIKESNPSMSLATVYKNLTFMQEAKIVDEVKLPNQKQRYELVKNPHIHLVCEKCGSITDMELERPIDALKKTCAEASHFKIKETSIAMIGVCPHCQD